MDARWLDEFPGAVTVCDRDGTILAMNRKAAASFATQGGAALVGQSVFACHPEAARRKIEQLLAGGGQNVYTIEKKGVRKLIYQVPWYEGGVRRGLVELSLELPAELPHHVRG